MNIQNVAMLAQMLIDMGFNGRLGYELLKRVTFRPAAFSIRQTVAKGKDLISFHVFFEKKDDAYHFKYYDASLRKDLDIPEALQSLDKKMESINWGQAFTMNVQKEWSADDSASWKSESQIEAIIAELEAVEDKEAAGKLKVKHWGYVEQDIFNLTALCAKFEITQRFYFFDGQGCIGADEAYKFLHNRWMEKQMVLAKRKAEPVGSAAACSGRGNEKLLPKKRGEQKKKGLLS